MQGMARTFKKRRYASLFKIRLTETLGIKRRSHKTMNTIRISAILLIIITALLTVGCNSSSRKVTLSADQEIQLNKQMIYSAIKAMREKNYKTAYSLWRILSNRGDTHATVQLGLMHHRGQGRLVNYKEAMNWYLKVHETNGDALNNIGVLHRDGLGVTKNRKIAYILFLKIHMTGMGGERTVLRANRNLRREMTKLSKKDKHEALCYTSSYVDAYIKNKGSIKGIPQNLRASPTNKRIKELNWWIPGEIDDFSCPKNT